MSRNSITSLKEGNIRISPDASGGIILFLASNLPVSVLRATFSAGLDTIVDNKDEKMSERDALRFLAALISIAAHSVLATCDRLRTSCGFMNGKRLRGIGYNGSVTGEPHCDDIGHLMVDGHCVRTRHGEKNAISNTDRHYIRGSESIIIATPCIDCVKDQIEEGVKKINYVGSYDNAKGKEFITEMAERRGVVMNQFEVDWCEVFQKLFDLLARKGGILYRSGYRLKVTKEPLE